MSPPRRQRRAMLIPMVLIGFLLVATSVIWRRSDGLARARLLAGLDRQRATLTGERVRLEGQIRAARGRARLLPIVESTLGMRVPPDSNVVILPRPAFDSTAPHLNPERTTHGSQ